MLTSNTIMRAENVISVTSPMACLMVADRLVGVYQRPLISRGIHAKQSVKFTQKSNRIAVGKSVLIDKRSWADRKATLTNITTPYICGELKSFSVISAKNRNLMLHWYTLFNTLSGLIECTSLYYFALHATVCTSFLVSVVFFFKIHLPKMNKLAVHCDLPNMVKAHNIHQLWLCYT